MVEFCQSDCIWAKVVAFGHTGCNRANWLYSGKMLYSGELVKFRHKYWYSGKVVVFVIKWLYSGKNGCIQAKVVVIEQSGCIWAEVVVFGQKWLISG